MIARVALLFALVGCGPNLSSLVSDHHYREAICGADDGWASDRRSVGKSLARDADAAIHVHLIEPGELQPLLGDATGPITERARFLRVSVQTNILPVDGVELELAIKGRDGRRIGAPVSWEALASITGERLPAQVAVSTYATAGNVLRGFAAFLTAGTSLLVTRFKRGTAMVDAPDSEYRAQAPRAHALFHAMDVRGCDDHGVFTGGSGARCTWFFAVLPEAPLRLELTGRYIANRQSKRGRSDSTNTCSVVETTSVNLGSIDRVFGAPPRYRRVSELVP